MTNATGLMTAWMHVPPEREDEFNDWYNLEHLPQAVALPGFVRGRRYMVEHSKPKYLAWYDTVDEHVEPGTAFRNFVAHPTPWWTRMARSFEHRERMNFRLMCDVGLLPELDTPWLYIVHTDIPDHIVGEYNAWYDNEHLPRLVTVPGVIRARRYTAVTDNGPKYLTAYELTDRNAFESPEGLKARKTPWTEKMRSLFQNTRRSMCRLILPGVAHEQALNKQS